MAVSCFFEPIVTASYGRREGTMPSRETVAAFVAAVESGDHVGAIGRFYHDDASMQENYAEPRRGRDVLVAHEKKVLARVAEMRTLPAQAVVIDGDHVAINWIFEMIGRDGSVRRLDEVALQEWRGEKIIRERFFYDPSALKS
jgi:ketosteroid isomerase-like protein